MTDTPMSPRDVFWHNFRQLRRNMRNASPEEWAQAKMISRYGLHNWLIWAIMSREAPAGDGRAA